MGQKSDRRKKFISVNPKCCFCGGDAPTEEEDHIPSRALFDERQWPEGYKFPACKKCNSKSRYSESLVSMISRMFIEVEKEEQQKELERSIRGVNRNFPGLIDEMQPTSHEARKAVKRYGLEKPSGITYKELPLLSLKSPRIHQAIAEFGQKLFLALYYKHSKAIFPHEGRIVISWFTNLQIINGAIPEKVTKLFTIYPDLVRCNTNLNDQFYYQYGMTPDNAAGGFIAVFRSSFVIVGMVFADGNKIKEEMGDVIVGPYKHEER